MGDEAVTFGSVCACASDSVKNQTRQLSSSAPEEGEEEEAPRATEKTPERTDPSSYANS